ncbi:UDP-2,4-diacetamido-2,4,6-trideoxy-beta-L-altropyranose hydrolase [Pseudomonas sp. D1-36]|uniref:UDP-2,4-diacetamido-2,4, 6-trideoxy-beta-L-altropyranose hydrolase n=1 Tax=Pseudomonas sp. D1-36 TaxID=2817387 RepID=UPI003DA93996
MKGMKVVFRADASLQIGIGHVMRCLTLAEALRDAGADCHFICREHPGHLLDLICGKGFGAHSLTDGEDAEPGELTTDDLDELAHASWLGVSQQQDAKACEQIITDLKPSWLVVDHYGLDARWELSLKKNGLKLLVIDDLADRIHASDILLDQTFGRAPKDYSALVPSGCVVLCGAKYALLRHEFKRLRHYSLKRRVNYKLESILVSLGGVDKDNITLQVLEGLKEARLPSTCRITVVMGSTAPWLKEVQNIASTMPWKTEVLVGVSNMAQLMAECDLSIGAAGATSWERCCLGVPTALLVLAENQKFAANLLSDAKAVVMVSHEEGLLPQLKLIIEHAVNSPNYLKVLSESAQLITDGTGSEYIESLITKFDRIDGC